MQEDVHTRNLGAWSPRTVLVLGLLVSAIDGVCKYWSLTHLAGKAPIPLVPWVLSLFLHHNQGVIANIPLPRVLVLVVTPLLLLGFLVWSVRLYRARDQRHQAQLNGLLLLLCGGMGNWLDRLLTGSTTDYLLLFHWSIANLSDGLILIGLLLLFLPSINKTSQ